MKTCKLTSSVKRKSTSTAQTERQAARNMDPAAKKERRKAKQVVHRDPIWGGSVPAPKKQALSRNFDGSADAYGEVTMYDSDDETYAMKKQREAAADAEAACAALRRRRSRSPSALVVTRA